MTIPKTPIADALLKLRQRRFISFHGLPISSTADIEEDKLTLKYVELFGQELMRADLAITGRSFDSFFFPKRVIARAAEFAAQTFGANQTFFVTAGTTMAIQIALEALVEPFARVLVDRSCHQSVHLALNRASTEVSYAQSVEVATDSNRTAIDWRALVQACKTAKQLGKPFSLVVLTGCSYDGVMLNLTRLLEILWDVDKELQILVDEAWSSHASFHPRLQPYSAMVAAAQLKRTRGFCAPVVAVQSAHKSLNALRQGSFIHLFGKEEIGLRLRDARFAFHTTSPSYIILASLDLARAQMQHQGEKLVDRALRLADEIRYRIANDKELSGYSVNTDEALVQSNGDMLFIDPTRISLKVSRLGLSTRAFKHILAAKHQIFLSRSTQSSVLLNIHIGIDVVAIDHLLQAMAQIQTQTSHRGFRGRKFEEITFAGIAHDSYLSNNNVTSDFLIPYPPGVPAIVPGEKMDAACFSRVSSAVLAGAEVIRLAGRTHIENGSSYD